MKQRLIVNVYAVGVLGGFGAGLCTKLGKPWAVIGIVMLLVSAHLASRFMKRIMEPERGPCILNDSGKALTVDAGALVRNGMVGRFRVSKGNGLRITEAPDA